MVPLSDSPPLLSEGSSHLPEDTQKAEETCLNNIQQIFITSIRATDLTLGLRRIPAGFYVTVQAEDAQWQTTNKPVHVDADVIEWNERIVLPPEPSCKTRFRIYASFELGSMLGHGDLLRTLETSVAELLDRSEHSYPFVFQPKAGEVTSPCASLFITVKQPLSSETDASVPCPPAISTPHNMRDLIVVTDAGHCILGRYHRTQDVGDLDQSIKHFERAHDLCPDDHPCHPAALFNLAAAKFISCQVKGNYFDFDLDLEITISLFQDALELRSTGHPDRPTTQLHLAIALLSRFVKRGFQTDADAAKELLNEVLLICDAKSHISRSALLVINTYLSQTDANDRAVEEPMTDANDRPVEEPMARMFPWSLSELASRVESLQQSDDPRALDEVISLHYEALKYYSTAHPERGSFLNNLCGALQMRFERRGTTHDLEEAIKFYRELLHLHSVGSPDRSLSLNNIAVALFIRFKNQGNFKDLEEAIASHREALHLRPVGHPDRSWSLNNLATVLFTRFNHQGNIKDLDEAITFHWDGLHLRPVGHPFRSSSLNNIAAALYTRFMHQGDEKDLEVAIAFYQETLHLRPVGHPDRSMSLNNLAAMLFTRFDHKGNEEDLEEAITSYREALDLKPVGHMSRSSSLNNLANALSVRFKHQGNGEDLEEAITFYREALHVRPVGHPDRVSSLNNLANTLSTRFQHQGNGKDLEDAITFHREALHLRPVGHPDRSSSLNNLSNALSIRFQHQGNIKDLEEAITFHREALRLQPVGHPDWSSSLNKLANVLITRFEHEGNGKDLEEAIAFYWEVLHVQPVGHPGRFWSLDGLATALYTRFMHQGNEKDLEEAIVFYWEALHLRPAGHSDRSLSLDNLAVVLSARFDHRGNEKDLDEAIAFYREALHVRPVGHLYRSTSLNNLANALFARFKHQGNGKDIEEAIVFHTEALHLRPVSHPHRSTSLNNLANALITRFDHQGNGKDLEEAIAFHREALHMQPAGHPDRFLSLNNLSLALSSWFEHKGNAEDLHEALSNAHSALSLFTAHDHRQSIAHVSLSDIYLLLHQSRLHPTGEDVETLNAAMNHFKAAAELTSSGLLFRLHASLRWVSRAKQYMHSTLLDAYATSMHLLDAHMSATASVSSRHHTMKLFPSRLAVDAASCALQHGDVCRAVELLEQGRTLIWTQMARFRVPLDDALERGDEVEALVKKFRELSSLLDKHPAKLPEGTPRVKVEAEAARYTHLVDEWNKVVGEIRSLEGFSRFLLPPLFSDLQDAARDGPIIVLIASELSCDVIIVHHQHSPFHVRLDTSLEKIHRLIITLHQTVDTAGSPEDKRAKLVEALRELWDDVVSHVVENLGKIAQPGSRIWWCPTSIFNFLPLHAAGEYRRGGKNLSRIYISSYTPSLTALTRARRSHDRSQPVLFAAIGQNHPPGFKFALSSVEPELELVQSLLSPASRVSFTKVTSIESTKSVALRTLRDHHWLHFACHGIQNLEEPFNSAFLMRDEPLTLLDITQTNLSRHEFAFLSACETAVGNTQSPDEVIHLAAGLQFAGVRSVIGTFWSVDDSTVRHLVEAFYRHFCGDGKMDSRRAAVALHRAVQSIARNTDIPLEQRIVFMHIGI